MARIASIALVAASLLIIPVPAVGAEAFAEAYPPGGVSCSKWTEGRETIGRGRTVPRTPQGIERVEQEGWVLGYITALNGEVLPQISGASGNVMEDTNIAEVMVWIDDYCTENPTNSLAMATMTLGRALLRQWQEAHP